MTRSREAKQYVLDLVADDARIYGFAFKVHRQQQLSFTDFRLEVERFKVLQRDFDPGGEGGPAPPAEVIHTRRCIGGGAVRHRMAARYSPF